MLSYTTPVHGTGGTGRDGTERDGTGLWAQDGEACHYGPTGLITVLQALRALITLLLALRAIMTNTGPTGNND